MTEAEKISKIASQEKPAYVRELELQEETRLRNYAEFWRLYRGDHWDESEMDTDRPTPTKNKCMIIVNKSISFLVGKPFTVNYPDESAETLLAPYVNMLLRNSGGLANLGFLAAQMGSVTGDVFLKSVYDPSVPMGVRIEVCDSSDVSVRYNFRDYRNCNPDQAQISWRFLDHEEIEGTPVMRTKTETWTDIQKFVYIDEEFNAAESGVNLLGQVPIVHIRNLPIGKSPYGMSDIEQLEPLNKLLNSQLRRFKEDVDYHGDPVTLLFGARVSELERGANKLWANLPAKARVENLTLDTDFPAQQKFMEYLDESIHEIGNVPKDSVSGKTAVSNTSGVALHTLFMPLVELTDRKRLMYGPGFAEAIMMGLRLMYLIEKRSSILNTMPDSYFSDQSVSRPEYRPTGLIEVADKIAKMYSESKDGYTRFLPWYTVEVEFQDYMPKDQQLQINLIKEKMTLNILSRRMALKELGVNNIDKVLKECDDEAAAAALQQMRQLYEPEEEEEPTEEPTEEPEEEYGEQEQPKE